MIVYGKKRVPQLQQLSAATTCPHCMQSAPILVVGCVEYAHIYWIPLFAWRAPVYLCSVCQKTLVGSGGYSGDVKTAIPTEARTLSEKLIPQVTRQWYHFLGVIAAGIAIAYAMATGQ